jgi:hypothetical protein
MANGKCKCGVDYTLENSTSTVFKRQQGFCRSCDETYQKQYYLDRSERIKERSCKWARKNKKKRLVIAMKYWDTQSVETRASHNKKVVAQYRLKKFGISQEEFDAKFESQKGLCSICEQPMLAGVRKKIPCQDHNHDTGELRDLLCSSCNLLIGNCCEDEKILVGAIKYLRKHKSGSSIKTALCGLTELNSVLSESVLSAASR